MRYLVLLHLIPPLIIGGMYSGVLVSIWGPIINMAISLIGG